MDLIQSILLWSAGLVSLTIIMFYVLRSPRTPQRPELGLGKRYQVGAVKRPRKSLANAAVRSESQTAAMPLKTAPAPQAAPPQLEAAACPSPDSGLRQDFLPRENHKQEQLQTTEAESTGGKVRKQKRGDTLQFMLNKAIAERK